jgi:hypothetical protein
VTAHRILSQGRSAWTRPASYHRNAVWGFDLPEPPSWGERKFLKWGAIAALVLLSPQIMEKLV